MLGHLQQEGRRLFFSFFFFTSFEEPRVPLHPAPRAEGYEVRSPKLGAVLLLSLSPNPQHLRFYLQPTAPPSPSTCSGFRVPSSVHGHTPLTFKCRTFCVFLYSHQVLSRHTLSGAQPRVWAWARGQWEREPGCWRFTGWSQISSEPWRPCRKPAFSPSQPWAEKAKPQKE